MEPSVTEPADIYTYKPLLDPKNNIRLLTIHPGQRDDLIQCTLTEELRGAKHVCLSYEWGTDEASKPILVNGRTMLIRSNLHAFLRQARNAALLFHPLWVDAICIDQSDSKEKSQQVADMFSTYSSAEKVFCWLGEGDSRVGETIDLINDTEKLETTLASRRTRTEIHDTFNDAESRKSQLEQREENQRHERHVASTLEPLLALSYWTRLWTVQEIQSQREVVLLYGSRELSSRQLWGLLEWNRFAFTNEQTCWATTLQNSDLWWRARDVGGTTEAHDVITRVLAFRYHACSNPLDRVYALRLAIPRVDTQLPIDYAMPPEQLLVHMIRSAEQEVRLRDIAQLMRLLGLTVAQVPLALQGVNANMPTCFQGHWHNFEPNVSQIIQGSSLMLIGSSWDWDIGIGYPRDWPQEVYSCMVVEDYPRQFLLALREAGKLDSERPTTPPEGNNRILVGPIDIYSISGSAVMQDGEERAMYPLRYCRTLPAADFDTISQSNDVNLSWSAALAILNILESVNVEPST